MPGFFDAVQNVKTQKPKVHTVTIQGQSLVVTLEKKLEVQKNGEDAYEWKGPTEIALKPKTNTQRKFTVLQQSDKGYAFTQNDPYWVEGITEKGYTWQIESE